LISKDSRAVFQVATSAAAVIRSEEDLDSKLAAAFLLAKSSVLSRHRRKRRGREPCPASLRITDTRSAPGRLHSNCYQPAPGFSDELSSVPLDNVADHEFAFHEFLSEFEGGYGGRGTMSTAGESILKRLLTAGVREATQVGFRAYLEELEHAFAMQIVNTTNSNSGVAAQWGRLPRRSMVQTTT